MRPALIALAAVVIVVVLAISTVLFVLQSTGPSGPPPGPRVESRGHALATPDLVDALGRLDESTRTLSARIETLSRRLEPGRAGAEKTETNPRPKPPASGEVAELTKAVQALGDSIQAIPARTGVLPPMSRVWERQLARRPPRLKSRWKSDADATRQLRFRTYADILELVGPPKEIHGTPEVWWYYPDGAIKFVDGYLSLVNY